MKWESWDRTLPPTPLAIFTMGTAISWRR